MTPPGSRPRRDRATVNPAQIKLNGCGGRGGGESKRNQRQASSPRSSARAPARDKRCSEAENTQDLRHIMGNAKADQAASRHFKGVNRQEDWLIGNIRALTSRPRSTTWWR